jgi:hypothetical protein
MFHLSLSKHGSSYSRLVNGFVAKATRRVRYVEECGYRHNACVIVNICIQCWIHIWPIIMQGCRLFPLLCRNDFQDITTRAQDKLHETEYCSTHPVSHSRNCVRISFVSIIFSFFGLFVDWITVLSRVR